MLTLNSDSEPFRQTLTSAARNINLETWQTTHRDFEFKSPAPWSVQKYRLRGGRQEGVDIIVVNNGRLNFIVVRLSAMLIYVK